MAPAPRGYARTSDCILYCSLPAASTRKLALPRSVRLPDRAKSDIDPGLPTSPDHDQRSYARQVASRKNQRTSSVDRCCLPYSGEPYCWLTLDIELRAKVLSDHCGALQVPFLNRAAHECHARVRNVASDYLTKERRRSEVVHIVVEDE